MKKSFTWMIEIFEEHAQTTENQSAPSFGLLAMNNCDVFFILFNP